MRTECPREGCVTHSQPLSNCDINLKQGHYFNLMLITYFLLLLCLQGFYPDCIVGCQTVCRIPLSGLLHDKCSHIDLSRDEEKESFIADVPKCCSCLAAKLNLNKVKSP
ncbi:hypothetical protein KP79_PYT12360 [Mizuhopecten yessoensis]|uniref:Uncharacterized protein n=1 Tax=Mizuhopecten yessoensis TaxID=6573 RepID=A0A210PZG2_MIZYE|nr:hypothetical protein KP79_PYT12360 [Mizuhopecten yessoensis]